MSTKTATAPRISNRKRDKRQGTDTLYRKLLAAGFSDEDIRASHTDNIRTRAYGVVVMDQPDGSDPIIGVGYGGDYRCEEERGQGLISERLAAEKSVQTHVVNPIKKITAFALEAEVERYLWRPFEEALDSVVKDAMSRRRSGQENVGEFHGGHILVLLVENADKLTHTVLSHLFGDAAAAGALRYGRIVSNPFSRAAVFYDERDISASEMDAIRAQEKFIEDAMRDVKPVRDRLLGHGDPVYRSWHIYFVGNPRAGTDRGTVYWLNGSFKDDTYQDFGWYTKAELEDIAARLGV